jgi:hypothetical protein
MTTKLCRKKVIFVVSTKALQKYYKAYTKSIAIAVHIFENHSHLRCVTAQNTTTLTHTGLVRVPAGCNPALQGAGWRWYQLQLDQLIDPARCSCMRSAASALLDAASSALHADAFDPSPAGCPALQHALPAGYVNNDVAAQPS